jgi:hypothetical protein
LLSTNVYSCSSEVSVTMTSYALPERLPSNCPTLPPISPTVSGEYFKRFCDWTLASVQSKSLPIECRVTLMEPYS